MKKIGYIVLLLFVVIVGLIVGLGNRWIEHFIRGKIEQQEGLSVETISPSVFAGNLKLSNIAYDKDGIIAEVDTLTVQNVSLLGYVFSGKLEIDELLINMPVLTYTMPDSTKQQNTIAEKENKKVPQILIKEVTINQGKVAVKRPSQQQPMATFNLQAKASRLSFADFAEIDSVLTRVSSITLDSLKFITQDGYYTAKANRLTYSDSTNELLAKKISYTCNYDKIEFANVVGHQTSWIDFNTASITLPAQKLTDVFSKKTIETVVIQKPELFLFTDKRQPFNESKRPKLLKEILATAEVSLSIDSIAIQDGNITYQEFAQKATQPGEITFNTIHGSITHAYTFDRESDKPMHFTAQCKLFNEASLHADISFPKQMQGKTIVKGKLVPMSLTAINPMVNHVAFIEIESGKVNQLDFTFEYDTTEAQGSMTFAYQNLKVSLLKKKNSEIYNLSNELASMAANVFIIQQENRVGEEDFREGKISFTRVRTKSMFNLWWKSILSGLKTSVGIENSSRNTN